jgi:hypothetical protein
MDVYPGAALPHDLSVRYFFHLEGDATSVLEREVIPVPPGSTLTATVTITISDLPAGAYAVTATVLTEGRPLGSQSASFTIRGR